LAEAGGMISFIRRTGTVLGAALFAGLLSGCRQGNPPEEEHHAAPVKWEEPKTVALEEWVELLGITQPLPGRSARVSAGVEGQVVSVLSDEGGTVVGEGQEVSAGQVLVRLDDRVIRANRDKLLATEKELAEQARQAGFTVELARIDVERLERLASRSNGNLLPDVSRVEREKARVTLQEAEARQKVALAHLDVARAERRALEEQLALYTLRAPIAGRLGLVHAVLGHAIPIGTVVAEIVDLGEIDVLSFVPAGIVSRLELGQEAHLETESEGSEHSETVTGKVAFIGAQAQAETGTVGVKVRFPNRKLNLRANTLRQVRVRTRSKSDCLTIPTDALLEDQDQPAVLVAVPGKNDKGEEEFKAHKYQVVLGLRDNDKKRVEVLGLKDPETKKEVRADEHTRFITEGGHGLEDGDLVKEEEEHEEHKEGEEKEKMEKEKEKEKDK
jgi:RND family efflux transporter MFP subunit